jgi:hypothetical protein
LHLLDKLQSIQISPTEKCAHENLREEAENVPVAGAELIRLRKGAYMLRYPHIGKLFRVKNGGEELPGPEKFSHTFYTVHDFLPSLQCGRPGPLEASNSDRRLLIFDMTPPTRMRVAVITACLSAFLASRSLTATENSPLKIGAPLDSLKTSELHDSFNEIRNGHRHEAIDIMRPRGTPIRAVADGTIRKVFISRAGGLTIYEFDLASTYCFYYAHLDRYADQVHEGSRVARGDVIGYVGTTGDASADAPQLHFAIFRLGPDKTWWKGEAIDPYPILLRAEDNQ